MDNETWIIEKGDSVINKRSSGVLLSQLEKLIYCLWVADYCMRNAGDLENMDEMYPNLFKEAISLAKSLSINVAIELFSKSNVDFEKVYFEMFNSVCEELRSRVSEN